MKAIVVAFATLVLGLSYQLLLEHYTPEYLGYQALSWDQGQNCSRGGVPTQFKQKFRAVGTYSSGSPIKESRCRGSFDKQGNVLEIEYILFGQSATLTVVDQHDTILSITPLPPSANWSLLKVQAPETGASNQFFLNIRGVSSGTHWLAVRDRVQFYKVSMFETAHDWLESNTPVKLLIIGSLALALSVLLLSTNPKEPFWLLLLLAVATQFRGASFFFWDEWHALLRFDDHGLGATLIPHNEHVLPLFFGWFLAESKVLGENYQLYLIVSVLIHACNSRLVYSVLQQIGGSFRATLLLSCLFAISGLHSESLHWAFEQCLLLSYTACFLSLLFALRYIRTGNILPLIASAITAAITPLFFGNGFATPVYLFAIGLAEFATCGEDKRRITIFRTLISTAISALILIAPVLLYYSFSKGEGHGHGMADAKLFENLSAVGLYLLVGTQLGAVLRGLGLFPALQAGAPAELIQRLPFLQPSTAYLTPEVLFGLLGLGVSVIILVVAVDRSSPRKAILLWLSAQCIFLGSLILPALGRWHFGIQQSLSLRYYYAPMLGLCLMMLPIIIGAISFETKPGLFGSRSSPGMKTLLYLFLVAHIAMQLFLGSRFDYFSRQGPGHYSFAIRLNEWMEQAEKQNAKTYEAVNTNLNGLHPSYPATLSPGLHPFDAYRALHFLDAKKYPKKMGLQ